MLNTLVLLGGTYLLRKTGRGMSLLVQQAQQWRGPAPLISVVIPCYNHGQYLMDAVESIHNQTWQDFEILVVNDGSTEDVTTHILEGFESPKTRIIHLQQNRGLPAARNAGIREAQGKYICCLDADDMLHPTYLEKAIVAMEVNAGLSFVGAWTQVFGDEERVWYSHQFDPQSLIYANQFGPATVFRKKAWEQAGGFHEAMREGFEDWEFWVRLTAHGYRGYRIAEKLIMYRRIGYSFAQRAAEKWDSLFSIIQKKNASIYEPEKLQAIVESYHDIYSPRPLINLGVPADYIRMKTRPLLVLSSMNSRETTGSLHMYSKRHPLIWVASEALDEDALDLLFKTTPFIYILPNFVPSYARTEFVNNLVKIHNAERTVI